MKEYSRNYFGIKALGLHCTWLTKIYVMHIKVLIFSNRNLIAVGDIKENVDDHLHGKEKN